jgi:quercetin dioxygenase-like cupin family protein
VPLIRTSERARFLETGPYPQPVQVGERQALMLLCLQAGQELVAPAGDGAETTFVVLGGDGWVVEGDLRHAVREGDVVHVAPGAAKALRAGEGTFTVLGVRSMAGAGG